MKSPEMELLFPVGNPCEICYRPIKLHHPVAGFSYGIAGVWLDENGQKVGNLLLPDVSCDYLFVSRLAAKCTAQQLDPDQLLELLNKVFV